jgi:hypothetical protein
VTKRARNVALSSVALLASLSFTRAGNAQPTHDPAAAEAAFVEARALLAQGKVAEACPKLELSYTLDPALGTLLNLGDCLERTGRTASAWVRYREAASMAVQQNQREREAIARARASALEPRLCRLVVRAEARANLEVSRDGVPVATAAIGLAVPVDPGSHLIEAKAPDVVPFSKRVDVAAPTKDGACPVTTVDIPTLEGERVQNTLVAKPTPTPTPRPIDLTPDPAPPTPSSRWALPHTLAVVAAAGGVVAVGVGTVFALGASSTKNDADGKCTPAGCTAEGKNLLTDAGHKADAATVTFVIGGALLATGAVLWITSPSLRASTGAARARDLAAGVVRF